MQNVLVTMKEHASTLLRLLPLLAFLVPMILLILLNPADSLLNPIDPSLGFTARESFEVMWKGRAFQLFFVWLIALELLLDWEKLKTSKINRLVSFRTLVLIIALLLPASYMIVSNYFGLNTSIADFALQSNVHRWNLMPLTTEYLVYAIFYGLIVFLSFGVKGLKILSLPLFFLAAVGALYTIDNLYPYGQFTMFQFLVPTTTTLAAAVLNLMGYNTVLTTQTDPLQGTLPLLTASDPSNAARTATFAVAWPCAGIESLLIFTVVTLLFLKRMSLSWKASIGYFAVGAAVTYIINILRIAAIFLIGMDGQDITDFHFYYGPLYSIAWIVAYPLIILVSQSLWRKIKNRRVRPMEPQPPQPNLA
jgi:thaumarchaeosortase